MTSYRLNLNWLFIYFTQPHMFYHFAASEFHQHGSLHQHQQPETWFCQQYAQGLTACTSWKQYLLFHMTLMTRCLSINPVSFGSCEHIRCKKINGFNAGSSHSPTHLNSVWCFHVSVFPFPCVIISVDDFIYFIQIPDFAYLLIFNPHSLETLYLVSKRVSTEACSYAGQTMDWWSPSPSTWPQHPIRSMHWSRYMPYWRSVLMEWMTTCPALLSHVIFLSMRCVLFKRHAYDICKQQPE